RGGAPVWSRAEGSGEESGGERPESDAAAELPDEAGGDALGRGRLKGRSVLVVGAGQDAQGIEDPPIGNGRAMSILFAREGAAVAVADINADSAEETAEFVRAEGGKAEHIVADAADPKSAAGMFAEAEAWVGGPPDGVVMNVGIGAGLMIRGTSAEDWDRVMAVN